MSFKNQYIANGTQTTFPFTFKIPTTRKVNVYVQQGVSANEQTDLVSPGDYTLNFNQSSGEPSDGNVIFNTAPANRKVVTITPDDETAISYEFSNTVKFNAENLNNSFAENSSTNNYQLSNYIGASIRYNFNENDSLLTYSNLVPVLGDKAFWRRDGNVIISQDYNLFVQEVSTNVSVQVNERINATASNTSLSANIAGGTFGTPYSGQIKTIDAQGNIVVGPTITGQSSQSGAESSRRWAESLDPVTDAYGNTGFSSRYYSDQALNLVESAGGVIDELVVLDPVNPTTKVDLVDYMDGANPQPWQRVKENGFSVYIDGIKIPDPLAYSGGTAPTPLYSVTIVTNPTVANPSYITFNPAIACPSGEHV